MVANSRSPHPHDAEIRRLNESGVKDSEIARRLGTCRSYVQKRRKGMGLKPQGYHLWTEQEKAELLRVCGSKEEREAFARRIGVTRHALNCQLRQHGEGQDTNYKFDQAHKRKSKAWELLSRGKSVREVAQTVGVHPTMVRRYKREMERDGLHWWGGEAKLIRGAANGDASGGRKRDNDAA